MEDRHSPMVQAVASTLRAAQTNCTVAMFSKVNGCGEHVDLSLIGWSIYGIADLIMEWISYYGRNLPTVVGFILFPADVLIKPRSGTRVRPRPMCLAIFPILDARELLLFIENDAARA
jgi:hypothetical protein